MITNLYGEDYQEDILQTSHNNIILTFKPSSGVAIKAVINFDGEPYTFYPNPNNEFYINLMPIVKNKILLQNKGFDLVDNNSELPTDPSVLDLNSNIQTAQRYSILISIEKIFGNNETKNTFVSVLRGVRDYLTKDQLNYKVTSLDYADRKFFLLHPKKIKMWEGYPFEIYTLRGYADVIKYNFIKSNSSSLFNIGKKDNFFEAHRLKLSTGDVEINKNGANYIERNGITKLELSSTNTNKIETMTIEHIQNKCGHYFKWVSDRSVYYFLLSNVAEISRGSRSDGEINNDFNNINIGSISINKSTGRTSKDSIKAVAKKTDAADREILRSLTTSPKIYYYLGEKGQRSSDNDWMEVKLKNHNFPLQNLDLNRYDISFEFETYENPKLSL